MRCLFCCSTPYQVMVATLLRFQCTEEDDTADLILTDTFTNYDVTGERIINSGVYNDVFYAYVKSFVVSKTISGKIEKFRNIYLPAYAIPDKARSKVYDIVFFNCEDLFTFNITTFFKRKNRYCKIMRYEEGYSSYTNLNGTSLKSKKAIEIRNRILWPDCSINIDGFYVFEPEMLLKRYSCLIKKIDRNVINKNEYRRFIQCAFNTQNIANCYKEKIVIFEESFVNDGFDVDDIELFEQIIKRIGTEKIVVKLHPRSKVNRFSGLNVPVMKPDGIPWEAILLDLNTSNVTMIALGSGSVINGRLLAGDSTKAILLYKCLKKRPVAFDKNFDEFMARFHEKYGKDVFIPDSYDYLMSVLRDR